MSRKNTTDRRIEELPIIPQPAATRLNDKQQTIYRDHREKLARWAVTIGKSPDKGEGYTQETVKRRLYRLDKFYRLVWEMFDRFTVDVTPEHADRWMRELAMGGNSEV